MYIPRVDFCHTHDALAYLGSIQWDRMFSQTQLCVVWFLSLMKTAGNWYVPVCRSINISMYTYMYLTNSIYNKLCIAISTMYFPKLVITPVFLHMFRWFWGMLQMLTKMREWYVHYTEMHAHTQAHTQAQMESDALKIYKGGNGRVQICEPLNPCKRTLQWTLPHLSSDCVCIQ